MPAIEVIFYEKENGDVPVNEFLSSLNAPIRAKILWTLHVLREKGYELHQAIFFSFRRRYI